jgi:hypothetical protein
MNETRSKDGGFEEKLLVELKSVVAQRGREATLATEAAPRSAIRRQAPRLALGATAVVAAAAAVLVISSGSDKTTKAVAVEPQESGGVTIKVYSPEDAAGLEAALEEAGIRSQVTWLPAGMTCREPHYTTSTAKTALGGTIGGMNMAGPGAAMTIGVMTVDQYEETHQAYERGELSESEFNDLTGNITVDPTQLRPDQTIVISGAPGPSPGIGAVVNGATKPFKVDPEGGYEAHFGVAEGQVEPCEPVAVSGGGMLGEMNQALRAEAESK